MKYVFILCCLFFAGTISAQSSKQSMSVVSTDNTYTFSVKLDRDRGEELADAYLKLLAHTGKPSGVAKIVGTSEMETANGTQVLLNTKRASLKVISAEDSPSSIAEARRYVEFLREELNMAPAPAPPAPPKVH